VSARHAIRPNMPTNLVDCVSIVITGRRTQYARKDGHVLEHLTAAHPVVQWSGPIREMDCALLVIARNAK